EKDKPPIVGAVQRKGRVVLREARKLSRKPNHAQKPQIDSGHSGSKPRPPDEIPTKRAGNRGKQRGIERRLPGKIQQKRGSGANREIH
ncbi:hypothetical protein AKJ39_03540, partial [candidate division MSBL1 archaeon SCGC-AAA259J03]